MNIHNRYTEHSWYTTFTTSHENEIHVITTVHHTHPECAFTGILTFPNKLILLLKAPIVDQEKQTAFTAERRKHGFKGRTNSRLSTETLFRRNPRQVQVCLLPQSGTGDSDDRVL